MWEHDTKDTTQLSYAGSYTGNLRFLYLTFNDTGNEGTIPLKTKQNKDTLQRLVTDTETSWQTLDWLDKSRHHDYLCLHLTATAGEVGGSFHFGGKQERLRRQTARDSLNTCTALQYGEREMTKATLASFIERAIEYLCSRSSSGHSESEGVIEGASRL